MTGWGTSARQRLRLAPLYLAIRMADALARMVPSRPHRARTAWPAGISVLIPERDAPDMLEQALGALDAALMHIDEPVQVIVVANGAPRERYAALRARWPTVDWVHSDAPLGFAQAVQRGLSQVRHGGVYLLNNDMLLGPDALAHLLPLRAPDTFAVASQIFQRSADGRREESGFTDWYVDRAGLHLFHAQPPADDSEAAAHLCASGGATLFRTALLRRYLPASRAYDPFYWEDAEWGLRAWREGYRVTLCSASHATHRHRASTARFYDAATLARIVERNRLLFDLRHGASGRAADAMLAHVCALPYASQRELARWRCASGVLRWRSARTRAPQPSSPPVLIDASGRSAIGSSFSFELLAPAAASTRSRVLVVAPFAVFPPRHGGARRVAAWLRGLKGDFAVSLVGDEASLYDARSLADFDGLAGVRLVQRDDDGTGALDDLATRMHAHCHPSLRAAVAAAIRDWRPHVVVLEHAELAPLVRDRVPGVRIVLDLHDAYGAHDFARLEDAQAFARDVAACDAVFVCSGEDRALVAHPNVAVLPNGASAQRPYAPSAGTQLLFVGPFRYAPNRSGIVEFLRDAWPAIRAAVPGVTLAILGGNEALAAVAGEPVLHSPGVSVHGHRDDVPQCLADSVLSINPLRAIRGSAVKLAETLAAGRVCVSTRDGARGFTDAGHAGLVVVDDVAAMAGPIVDLLEDAASRHRLERATAPDAFGWHHAVARYRATLQALLRD